jgi:hypothetical protein
MGTRSLHIFPFNGKKKTQYLQFDGYPENQIIKFINDSKYKINSPFFNLKNKKERAKYFLEYLNAYYNYRAYDSEHSVKANYTFNQSDDELINKLIKSFWVEYSYEWTVDEDSNIWLTVTDINTKELKIFTLNNLLEYANKLINSQLTKEELESIFSFDKEEQYEKN